MRIFWEEGARSSLDIVSWRDCECPLWVETKLFPISRGCFIRILETRFRLEGKPCSKFLLEIYIYRGVPFLFFSFLFFSREEDLHFGKNKIVPREESVSRDCSRVPLSLSPLLFQILETVYFRWNSWKILKKNYQRDSLLHFPSIRVREEKDFRKGKEKNKKKNYSNFVQKGIDFSGNIVLELRGRTTV